jgi:lipopolysaccharide biosynthesis glycosyltransferase
MPNSDVLHVALCANERYFPGLYLSIASALRAGGDLRFHVIDAGLSEPSKESLRELVRRGTGQNLSFVQVPAEQFASIPTGEYHISAYYRLALPSLLPDVSSLVYLDSDTLVFNSLALLAACRDSGSPLAAVQDWETKRLSGDSPELARLLGSDDVPGYLNSGVLWLDLDHLRAVDFTARACDLLRKHGHLPRFPDQTILNHLFTRQWHLLEPLWNTPARAFDAQSENRAPHILHFTKHAPWLQRRYTPSQALFERLARDFAFTLPKPEHSMVRSCGVAVLQWLLAPSRVGLYGIAALVAMLSGASSRAGGLVATARYWMGYFTGGPQRVMHYRRRIREIDINTFDPYLKDLS